MIFMRFIFINIIKLTGNGKYLQKRKIIFKIFLTILNFFLHQYQKSTNKLNKLIIGKNQLKKNFFLRKNIQTGQD